MKSNLNFKCSALFFVMCCFISTGFAQVKRSTLSQSTIGKADFVLESVINLKTNDTVVSINITFYDLGKVSTKKRVFISFSIEKSKTTYFKMISNFKEAIAFKSAEFIKTWENEFYQLESSPKEVYKFSQPDKKTQGSYGYTQFSNAELQSIVTWLEGLKW
jgi:hypothetical protein